MAECCGHFCSEAFISWVIRNVPVCDDSNLRMVSLSLPIPNYRQQRPAWLPRVLLRGYCFPQHSDSSHLLIFSILHSTYRRVFKEKENPWTSTSSLIQNSGVKCIWSCHSWALFSCLTLRITCNQFQKKRGGDGERESFPRSTQWQKSAMTLQGSSHSLVASNYLARILWPWQSLL